MPFSDRSPPSEDNIEGSVDIPVLAFKDTDNQSNYHRIKQFLLWSSSTTTIVFTSTVTNGVLSVSFACTVPGSALPPACG